MSDPVTIGWFGVYGAVGGFALAVLVLMWSVLDSFRSRLKSDVSRREALGVFPTYLRYEVREVIDWRAFAKGVVITAAGGAFLVMVLAVFSVGLIEVFSQA